MTAVSSLMDRLLDLSKNSLQYGSSMCPSMIRKFVHTSFVIFPKAAYVSSLTSFIRKVVLFLATKPLTCTHINYIGISSQCRTGVLNTSYPCAGKFMQRLSTFVRRGNNSSGLMNIYKQLRALFACVVCSSLP